MLTGLPTPNPGRGPGFAPRGWLSFSGLMVRSLIERLWVKFLKIGRHQCAILLECLRLVRSSRPLPSSQASESWVRHPSRPQVP